MRNGEAFRMVEISDCVCMMVFSYEVSIIQ